MKLLLILLAISTEPDYLGGFYQRGTIKTDEPYLIQMNDKSRVGCLWLAGSKLFEENDAVAFIPLESTDNQPWTPNGILQSVATDEKASVHCVRM